MCLIFMSWGLDLSLPRPRRARAPSAVIDGDAHGPQSSALGQGAGPGRGGVTHFRVSDPGLWR